MPKPPAPRITVTAEADDDRDDDPDALYVRIDGEEVGAYSIVTDAPIERQLMVDMVQALLAAGAQGGELDA